MYSTCTVRVQYMWWLSSLNHEGHDDESLYKSTSVRCLFTNIHPIPSFVQSETRCHQKNENFFYVCSSWFSGKTKFKGEGSIKKLVNWLMSTVKLRLWIIIIRVWTTTTRFQKFVQNVVKMTRRWFLVFEMIKSIWNILKTVTNSQCRKTFWNKKHRCDESMSSAEHLVTCWKIFITHPH